MKKNGEKDIRPRVRQMPTDEKIVKEALADTGKDAKVEKVTDDRGE